MTWPDYATWDHGTLVTLLPMLEDRINDLQRRAAFVRSILHLDTSTPYPPITDPNNKEQQ